MAQQQVAAGIQAPVVGVVVAGNAALLLAGAARHAHHIAGGIVLLVAEAWPEQNRISRINLVLQAHIKALVGIEAVAVGRLIVSSAGLLGQYILPLRGAEQRVIGAVEKIAGREVGFLVPRIAEVQARRVGFGNAPALVHQEIAGVATITAGTAALASAAPTSAVATLV